MRRRFRAILERLRRDGLDFPSFMLAQAFDAVAFLARNDKDRESGRVFLTEHLNHPREELRVAAAKALGTLRDPKSLAVLQPLTTTLKLFKDPVREAAEKSIAALEAEQTKTAGVEGRVVEAAGAAEEIGGDAEADREVGEEAGDGEGRCGKPAGR